MLRVKKKCVDCCRLAADYHTIILAFKGPKIEHDECVDLIKMVSSQLAYSQIADMTAI